MPAGRTGSCAATVRAGHRVTDFVDLVQNKARKRFAKRTVLGADESRMESYAAFRLTHPRCGVGW